MQCKRSGWRSNDVAKNKLKALVAYTTRSIALLTASGTLMQTFLSVLGFASNVIYVHSTLLQAFNVLTIVLCSSWANNGSPIKRAAFTLVPTGVLFLFYVPIAVAREASAVSFVLLCAIGGVQQMAVGLYTVYDYKMPYYIYRVEEYGMMLSVCGILSSLLSVGVGALISFLADKFTFITVMIFAFSLSALLMGIAFAVTLSQKSLRQKEEDSRERGKGVLALLKYPPFTQMIPANLMRGFSAGVIGVLATVALDLGYTEVLTSMMVSAQSIASLVACAFYACFAKKISPFAVIITGSLMILAMPMLLIQSNVLYLAVFTVVMLGRTLIDYAVPTALIRIVPVEMAGSYNAWRMALHNGGMLLATMVGTFTPVPVLLIVASALQIVSGINYCFFGKKHRSGDQC